VLIRRAWVGAAPTRETAQQLDRYRGYAPGGATRHWGADELAASTDPAEVVSLLADAVRTAGCDALNIRVHMPGIAPANAREQIERIGREAVPQLRQSLSNR
jgi:hypothetical protein